MVARSASAAATVLLLCGALAAVCASTTPAPTDAGTGAGAGTASGVAGAATDCQWNAYDLTPLSGQTLPGSDDQYTYRLHVCGVVDEATCASRGGALCQYGNVAPFPWQHTLAQWTATAGNWSACSDATHCPLGGVQVAFANGDVCGATGVPRSTTVVVACGTGNSLEYAVLSQECEYTVVFTHEAGCPVAPPASSSSSSTGNAPQPHPPGPVVGCEMALGATTYDLGALAAAGTLSDAGDGGDYTYRLQVCGNVTEPTCWAHGGAFCQYASASNGGAYVHTVAHWDPLATGWSVCTDSVRCPQGGVEVTLANGDRCAGGAPRNVTLQIACAPGGSNTDFEVEEDDAAPCAYLVRMAHAAGCGTTPVPDDGGSGGPTGGQVAGAVIGSLLGVALLGGAFYWYRYRYLPSQEQSTLIRSQPTADTSYSNL